MTLWILFCRMSKNVDTLFTFYARDREDAERKAEKILAGHPYERLELKEYPRGFRMVRTYIPGILASCVDCASPCMYQGGIARISRYFTGRKP